MTTSIAVVIPNHNYGAFLAAAVRSATEQSLSPSEIVVVDDGSTDDSMKEIKRIQGMAGPFLQVVRHGRRLGAVRTFNDGVRATTAERIVILSADDLLPPNYLETLSTALDRNGWDFAYPAIVRFGSEVDRTEARPLDLAALGERNYICGSAMFHRRNFDAISGFHRLFERVGYEDHDFWLRMVRSGARGGPVNTTHLLWRRHAQGSRNTLSELQWLAVRFLLWTRHPTIVPRPRPMQALRRIGRASAIPPK